MTYLNSYFFDIVAHIFAFLAAAVILCELFMFFQTNDRYVMILKIKNKRIGDLPYILLALSLASISLSEYLKEELDVYFILICCLLSALHIFHFVSINLQPDKK